MTRCEGASGESDGAEASEQALVGVVLVGHGRTASALLEAARDIVGADTLPAVRAIDAGVGRSPALETEVAEAIHGLESGLGVVLIVDLVGSSPWRCCAERREKVATATLGGLNLAMLLKLASLDRRSSSPASIITACAKSATRAIRAGTGQSGDATS